MKTLTLNLSDKEMSVLETLAEQKGMSKTAILRQALRMYQTVDVRLSRGERLYFSGDGGKLKPEVEVIVL